MMKLEWIATGLALTIATGCGGKVIVDGGGNSGAGGAGGAGVTSSNGSVNVSVGASPSFGMTCMVPPDPNTLKVCGGSGSGGMCATNFCDGKGNTYAAACEATTCVCTLNGKVMCSCSLNGPAGDFCGGTPECCPWLSSTPH